MKFFLLKRSFLKLSFVIRLLTIILFIYPITGYAAQNEVIIGILAKRGVEHALHKWKATAEYLNHEIPGYQFIIKPLNFDDVSVAVAKEEIDFILTNPSIYVELEVRYGVNRIATLRNRVGNVVTSKFGSVIFFRADRDDLGTFNDLMDKSLIAVDKNSLGGFHMALWELKRHDINPYKDMSRLEFGGTHDAVVESVIKGETDIGIVRTDTLERMSQEGKLNLTDIKILNQHMGNAQLHYPFLHSTEHYPEWPLASLSSTSPELAQMVTVALLRMSPESEAAIAAKSAGWGVPLNYQPVHELLKTLRIGVYKNYGKITFWDVLSLYWYWLVLGVTALVAMTVVTTYIARLNKRLNESHQDLHEARNNMEIRVMQRTHELQQTNVELQDVLQEHKKTLHTLQKTSREKQLLLDSAGEGIYGIDNDGNVVFANAFTVKRLGWNEDELIGNSMHKLTHHTRSSGESYPFDECPVHSTLIKSIERSASDDIFWCKDGSSFPVEFTSTPIFEDGEQKGVVVVFRDIAQRRQTEEALRRTQKMDALGKLTGGIAHDFNNMLGVILGYSDLLLHKVQNDPALEDYAKQIKIAGNRAKILTTKLLAFSRKEIISAEPIDINQVLVDGCHMLEKTLTARIELTLELKKNLWNVWLDKASLEDAVLNMCINAMHAIPENGSITLSTSNVHLDKADLNKMNIEAGDYVLLKIADTGKGMDQQTKQLVFEPFFSTKGEQGTGLGMSQVYGFVQQSSGSIHIESKVGSGTQILIYLPRYYQSVIEGEKKTDDAHENDLSGKETILVVDDEAALRKLSKEILTSAGYRVKCADSGEQALEMLEQESFDLVFSDVVMPRMNGYELVNKIQEIYPAIKIQMASGYSDENKIPINEELHERRLHKPFTRKELLQHIHQLLNEKDAISDTESLRHIEWSVNKNTGLEIIDDDHKNLVSLFNRCIDVTEGSYNKDRLIEILEELLNYINIHFRREEVIMKICDYPGLSRHKQQHEQLIDSLNQYIKAFTSGELRAETLLYFLYEWLSLHVFASDGDLDFIPYSKGNESIIESALAKAGLSNVSAE